MLNKVDIVVVPLIIIAQRKFLQLTFFENFLGRIRI